MKKKKKDSRRTEKFLYRLFVFTTISLVIGIVYSRASLSKINLEVQNLNAMIKDETEDNQSLVMKINEKVSLEKIQEISDKMGLKFDNKNIVSITE